MSLIKRLREHFSACPLLNENAPLHVDGLKPDPENYSIAPKGGETVLEEYLDGSCLKRSAFVFSIMGHGTEDSDRMAASALLEEVAAWMERGEKLPVMDDGQKAQRLRATGGPVLKETGGNGATAAYEMQCELQYFEEADREEPPENTEGE